MSDVQARETEMSRSLRPGSGDVTAQASEPPVDDFPAWQPGGDTDDNISRTRAASPSPPARPSTALLRAMCAVFSPAARSWLLVTAASVVQTIFPGPTDRLIEGALRRAVDVSEKDVIGRLTTVRAALEGHHKGDLGKADEDHPREEVPANEDHPHEEVPADDSDATTRLRAALKSITPGIMFSFLGEEDIDAAMELALLFVGDRRYNKQLWYDCLDAVVLELFPATS